MESLFIQLSDDKSQFKKNLPLWLFLLSRVTNMYPFNPSSWRCKQPDVRKRPNTIYTPVVPISIHEVSVRFRPRLAVDELQKLYGSVNPMRASPPGSQAPNPASQKLVYQRRGGGSVPPYVARTIRSGFSGSVDRLTWRPASQPAKTRSSPEYSPESLFLWRRRLQKRVFGKTEVVCWGVMTL